MTQLTFLATPNNVMLIMPCMDVLIEDLPITETPPNLSGAGKKSTRSMECTAPAEAPLAESAIIRN
jgi:hypothetical protein